MSWLISVWFKRKLAVLQLGFMLSVCTLQKYVWYPSTHPANLIKAEYAACLPGICLFGDFWWLPPKQTSGAPQTPARPPTTPSAFPRYVSVERSLVALTAQSSGVSPTPAPSVGSPLPQRRDTDWQLCISWSQKSLTPNTWNHLCSNNLAQPFFVNVPDLTIQVYPVSQK